MARSGATVFALQEVVEGNDNFGTRTRFARDQIVPLLAVERIGPASNAHQASGGRKQDVGSNAKGMEL